MKHSIRRAMLLIMIFTLLAATAAAKQEYGSAHNQRYDGYEIRRGIDVSEHNGAIDWTTAHQSGMADFTFIRAAYRGYSSGGIYPDARFKENLSGALYAGLDVGVYIYSQATSVAEAREEANYVIELLGSAAHSLSLPIVFDFEFAEDGGFTGRLYEAHLSRTQATEVCNAFCDTIRQAGLTPCVYANPLMLSDYLLPEHLTATLWLANYTDEAEYDGAYEFWQYTGSGSVPGLKGEVDCNYWYVSELRNAVHATELEMESALNLDPGERAGLNARLYPSNTVDTLRYVSLDPSVAYVDKITGEVTGFCAGTTEILATTGNGLQQHCRVTVHGTNDAALGVSLRIVKAECAILTGNEVTTEVTVASEGIIGGSAVVAVDHLNLRACPNTDFAPLATLDGGERLVVLGSSVEKDATWLAVRRELDGQTGYVVQDYLADFSTGEILVEGRDYVLTYENNDRPGTATVTATGIGYYTGSDSAEFTIFGFEDVKPGDWFYDTVLRAVRSGTMQGVSSVRFSPNVATNRAMMATVLYRMDGTPSTGEAAFEDVPSGEWYTDSVNWAAVNGVDSGMSGTHFAPLGILTRSMMVNMLYRYTQYLGCETPVNLSYCESFSDWSQVPGEAREAFCWAAEQGLIQGVEGNRLAPDSGATRAQICTILCRFEDLLAELHSMSQPELAGD